MNDQNTGRDPEALLEEALLHQRATSEVLSAISDYPASATPIFDAIVKRAADLCGAAYCNIQLYDGTYLDVAATYNLTPEILEKQSALYPMKPDPNRTSGRAILWRRTIHCPDLHLDETYPQELARAGNWRSVIAAPMLKRDNPVGVISVAQPMPDAYSPAQIQLMETFASQAVIALDNADLMRQLQARTDELAELNQTLEHRVQTQVEELDRMGRLRRFLPGQLAELIINSGDESMLDSHRREVSVVFCDLRGFTAFSEVSEPEEVMSVLSEYHAAAGPLIEQHGGTLERFIGDGLMVLFNDPLPCADPAQRAVRLAIEMRDAITALSKKWESQGHELGFGVGIAHGHATLGRIGFEGRSDYTAIGSVVNQAARLCDEAKAGEVLVTQRIANIVTDIVQVEPLGEIDLKGLRQAVRGFKLVEATE